MNFNNDDPTTKTTASNNNNNTITAYIENEDDKVFFFYPAGKKKTTTDSSSESWQTKGAKTEVIHVVVGVATVGSLGHEKRDNTKHPCVIMSEILFSKTTMPYGS